MKVRQIGSNQIQVDKDNGTFLVSYSSPVAARIDGIGWVRTETFHSVTTSRHINRWLENIKAEKMRQEDLEKHFSA